MKIAVACDHAGFPLKECVLEQYAGLGHEPFDLGTDSTAPVDYPDYAEKLGHLSCPGGRAAGSYYAARVLEPPLPPIT